MTNDKITASRGHGCGYWLLALLIGLLAIVALGTAVRVVTLPAELTAQVSLLLPLEVVAGALWAALFARAAWRLTQSKHGAVTLAWVLILAFATFSAVRLLIFARADYDRGRLPFLWVTLGLILLAAGLVRAAVRWRSRDELRRED
jgi:hypothetical protein